MCCAYRYCPIASFLADLLACLSRLLSALATVYSKACTILSRQVSHPFFTMSDRSQFLQFLQVASLL